MKSKQALMIQGATSDAGKSILATAFCRILARHGIKVAPFKPQNMALNSAVTVDGGEIGRAQAVQADACRIPPVVDMNPVLLKPNSETGSQVIVLGKAIGNMRAQEYHEYKPQLLATVIEAFERLSSEYQAVLIEGAGSPAEINLRESDIANMGFAEAIDCPVVIVADIDRGGVFAHLYGTYALLSGSEQKRVVGFVINRFRGDKNLLTPGLKWLEEKTGVPVLGVIPYLPDLYIEAEDSLSRSQHHHTQSHHTQSQSENRPLKLAVIKYPRTSNHTDFDVLRAHTHIDCQFYSDVDTFIGADIIVLPGSKSVRSDLQWLKQQGWMPVIERHLRLGGRVIGICGGYQMLGQHLHDPQGIESEAGFSEGLGLLNIDSTITAQKTLTNVTGAMKENKWNRSLLNVQGYEIHAGVSELDELVDPVFQLSSEDCVYDDGAWNQDKTVFGSYLHGLFDSNDMVNFLFFWSGIEKPAAFDYQAFKEQQIERLADCIESEISYDQLSDLLSLQAL